MKVLFISSGNKEGGLSPIIVNQGKSLIDWGVDIDFFSIKGKGAWSYFRNILILRNKLSSEKYDIIHAHYGFSGLVALIASKKEKIIISYMGDDILGTNRKDGKLTLSSKFIVKLNFFLSRWFYDHSLVKSNQMLKKLKQIKNVSLSPNGVNLDDFYLVERSFAYQKTGLSHSKINIVFISNPERHEKNFLLSLEAVKCLNDSTINLVPVFNVPSSSLKYYYSAADVLILTSFHEGSPNAIKEAMACNCPIVSTDVGDVRELIGEFPGHYLTSFNPRDVADKIRNAIEYSKSSGRTNGRKRISDLNLDSRSVANGIVQIYKKVLEINE